MPGVTSIDEFRRAVDGFGVQPLKVVCDDDARADAQASLDDAGLLLLGENHGVAENPLLIVTLMREFGLRSLALEWEEELLDVVRTFCAGESLPDDPERMWFGDGRLTAGHFAVLKALHGEGPLDLTFFVGVINAELTPEGEVVFDWSQHDREMAGRVLAEARRPTLVVAGNAHTPTAPHEYGTPMGAWLAEARPGVRDVRVEYRSGCFYSSGSQRFEEREPLTGVPSGEIRLRLRDGALVLDLPEATEAIVPHRH